MFGFLIETTSHTWDQILEQWDLPRYIAWCRYCNENPPVRAMIQGYLQIKPVKVEEKKDGAALLSVLSLFPGAVEVPPSGR